MARIPSAFGRLLAGSILSAASDSLVARRRIEGGVLIPSDYSLDVQSLALGRPWRPRLDGEGEFARSALPKSAATTNWSARVLAGRGVKPEAVERHLAPSFRDLMPVPFACAHGGGDGAPQRAVMRGEGGDLRRYDVDGACSAALFTEYLDACGWKRSSISPTG